MTIEQLETKIEKERVVEVHQYSATSLMSICEDKGWKMTICGGRCSISRPMIQGEDHPMYDR